MKKLVSFLLLFLLAVSFWSGPVQAASFSSFDVVVKFENNSGLADAERSLAVLSANPLFAFYSDPAGNGIYSLTVNGQSSDQVLSTLKSLPGVAWASLDTTVKAALEPDDEFFTNDQTDTSQQWYLPKIQAPQAWDIQTTSKDVTVAIVDTGIDALHQDLRDGRIVAGYESFCQDVSQSSCTNRIQGSISATAVSDDNGHGTAVASLVGAIGNNYVGIAGVSWDVKLMPIKVLNKDGVGTSADVAQGIVWAAQHGAQIINLSLGGATLADSDVMVTAIDIAARAGALVVAAAGNDKSTNGDNLDKNPSNPVCSDGLNNNVVGVAATDWNDQRAPFSNYGSKCIDISAPGMKMLTAYYDPASPDSQNIYAYRSGTSFSAPLVSGTAALLKQSHPDWTPAQLHSRLVTSAVNIDPLNQANCGGVSCTGVLGGRLNVLAALTGADNSPATTTPPVVPPTTPTIPADGTLIRDAGAADLYIMDGGKKRALITYVLLQRQLNPLNALVLPDSQFSQIPSGTPMPPQDGTIFKGDQSLTAFIMANGLKRPLTYFGFVSNGFAWNQIVTLPENYVVNLLTGKLYPPRDNVLIKSKAGAAVYVIKNGQKEPLTFFSFVRNNFSWKNVVNLDDSEVVQYVTGAYFPPPDGTLVKGNTDPTVYVFQGGSLHYVSYAAFLSHSYSWAKISNVPQSEITTYLIGNPLTL